MCALIISQIAIQESNASPYKLTVNVLIGSELFTPESEEDGRSECRNGSNKLTNFYFKPGTTIKVLNDSNSTVGLGKLTSSSFVRENDPELAGNQIGLVMGYCKYKGVVTVKKANYYQILLGGRGGVDFSFNDLKKLKWKVELSI